MPVPYKKHIVEPNEKQNSPPSKETVQKSHKASRERSSYHNNIVTTPTNDLPSCSIQDQHPENLPTSSNEPHGNASVIGDWRREKEYHSNSDFDIDESDEKSLKTLSGSSSSKSEATSESSISESEPLLPHPNRKLRRIITVQLETYEGESPKQLGFDCGEVGKERGWVKEWLRERSRGERLKEWISLKLGLWREMKSEGKSE